MHYGNCFFAILYLIFRGKANQVALVSLETDIWYCKFLCHFLAINKKGQIFHFAHSLPHNKNAFAPFWFSGEIKGISKSRRQKVLSESGRKILWITGNITFITTILIVIWILLFTPWMIMWSLYPIYWNIKSLVSALRKRYFKHR